MTFMDKLKVRTKGNAMPQGKPKVFFTCHPKDSDRSFDSICEDIFKVSDCAVYYAENMEDPFSQEEYDVDLDRMNLFVIPVSLDLLTTENRAMTFDFAFARSVHIPVLPIMIDKGLDQLYSAKDKFGALQYLDPGQDKDTGISYEEKLKNYLRSVLVSDEMASRIRSAFDAYVFLSYRKKDRKYADRLMRLLHRDPACRDIAVWYDEYLVPGEDFRNAIERAMEKSDLFALLVTPNLVNEENYVHTVEYPAAKDMNKKIIAMEMVKTDRDELYGKYEGLSDCFDIGDEDGFRKGVIDAIREVALRNDDDPLHNYLVGLAYLDGIDVEVDRNRALDLIRSSAESGLLEAMNKLCSMYRDGVSVSIDYEEALLWAKRSADAYKGSAEAEGKEAIAAYDVVANLCYLTGRYEEAADMYKEIYDLKEKLLGKEHRETRFTLSSLGKVYRRMGRFDEAAKLILESLEDDLKNPVVNKYLLISMSTLASCYRDMGNFDNALAIGEKAYELCREKYGDEDDQTLEYLNNLAIIHYEKGDCKKALEMSIEAYLKTCKKNGEKHPNSITSLDNLGVMYEMNYRYEDGYDAHKQAYDLSKEVLGEKHPGTIRCLKNLASNEVNLGMLKKAEEHMSEAYEFFKDFFGKENITTLSTLNNLANIYNKKKEYEKALDCEWEVYETQVRILGEMHPSTVISLMNLGIMTQDAEDFGAAFDICREAYYRCLKVFGKDHNNTLIALSYLSRSAYDSAHYLEELETIDREYHRLIAIPEKRNLNVIAETENNLIRTYVKTEDHENALKLMKERFQRDMEVYGENDLHVAHDMGSIANQLNRMGRYEEADAAYEEAYRLFLCCGLSDQVHGVQNLLCNRAQNYLLMGNKEKAEEICSYILDNSPMLPIMIGKKLKSILTDCGCMDLLEILFDRIPRLK